MSFALASALHVTSGPGDVAPPSALAVIDDEPDPDSVASAATNPPTPSTTNGIEQLELDLMVVDPNVQLTEVE